MIQLYKADNTEYEKNGDHVLHPTKCLLDRTLNGSWELTLEAPLDEKDVFKDIVVESVIKAPLPEGERLFYVYDTDKDSADCVTACARPVFLNAAKEVLILDKRPTDKNGQAVLEILTAGTRYSGTSDITTTNTAYYVRKNLIEAISSDEENSFLNRWGGEILYNDFNIVINKRIGGDYGARILYGKNLSSVKEQVNIEDVVTRIVPVAYNGYMLDGDAPWVDSPLISSYSHVKTAVIKYEDVKLTSDTAGDEVGFETLELLRAELVRRCNLEFDNGIDKPTVSLEVDMIDLRNVSEYKDYAVLESVSLGDTVGCRHSRMGISTTSRVIRQKWDCILQKNEELVIGELQNDYFDKLTSAASTVSKNTNQDGSIMAERLVGLINAMTTQLAYQKNVARRQDVRAILFEDLDESSDLYGALAIGTQGIQISKSRTADGKDWDWNTAITANGIIADAILTGLIGGRDGKSYWNLDSGKLVIKLGGDEDDRGVIELYDASGNLSGYFSSSGGDLKNLILRDRMIVYNLDESKNISIGFDGASGDFYISGGTDVTINIPYLYAVAAQIDELGVTNVIATGIVQGAQIIATQSVYSPYMSGKTAYWDTEIEAAKGTFESLYSTNGTVQKSDEQEKEIIGGMDERHMKFFMDLRPILFRWRENDNGVHAGFGARATEKAMRKDGIDEAEQFCVTKDGESYNMNYLELVPVIVAVLQRVCKKMDKMERRLKWLRRLWK